MQCPQSNSTNPNKSRKFSVGVYLQGHLRGEEFDLGGVFIEANSDVAQRAVEAFLRAHSLSEPPDVALTGEAKNYITEVAD